MSALDQDDWPKPGAESETESNVDAIMRLEREKAALQRKFEGAVRDGEHLWHERDAALARVAELQTALKDLREAAWDCIHGYDVAREHAKLVEAGKRADATLNRKAS